MPAGRVVLKRLPTFPGKNARFHIRKNRDKGGVLWIHYMPHGGSPIPADDSHSELVDLVNNLKIAEGERPGGGFSINEHRQVITHMRARPDDPGESKSIHVISFSATGAVATYKRTITFNEGRLSPILPHLEGELWRGPLCGMSYKFAKPNSPKAPSHKLEEVSAIFEDRILQLSVDVGINPYPPKTGPLANFLVALRRQLPDGGRFRVNEHGCAFTSSSGKKFIGIVPLTQWFKPLTSRS